MTLSDSRQCRRLEATLRPLPSHRTGLPRLPEPPFRRAEPTTPADRAGAHVDYFPRSHGLPQMAGGSASALSLSRPAQASLALRPVGSLSRPEATFVTRLQPLRLPARAARQLPDQSTTLRVESSSTDDSRLRGALPIPDSCSAIIGVSKWPGNLLNHIVGNQQEFARNRKAQLSRSLQIDDQLECGRLLHRQLHRFCPLENFVHIRGGLPC
jgi:hypothetical protein